MTPIDGNGWRALRPGSVDELPSEPGVFELGTLVRSVLLVGGEPDRPLREAVRDALAKPAVALQARCIRFILTADPASEVQSRLTDYRDGHAGNLPPEQPRRPHVTASSRRPFPARVPSTRAPASQVSRSALGADDALSA